MGVIIGLDFDGVIANTPLLKSRIAYEHFGRRIRPDVMGTPFAYERGFLNEPLYKDVQKLAYTDSYFAPLLELIPGAKEGIERLIDLGVEMKIVTARYGPALEYAQGILQKKGLEKIEIIGGQSNKQEATNGYFVFVDDTPSALASTSAQYKILMDWEFNKDAILTQNEIRCADWFDIHKVIISLITNEYGLI